METAELTVREVAELAEVPIRTVNKAIEEKVIPTKRLRKHRRPNLLPAQAVAYAAVIDKLDVSLSKASKRRLLDVFGARKAKDMTATPVEIAHAVTLNVPELVGAELGARTDAYLRRRDDVIERNPEILGGTPVVRGTRISVYSLLGRIEHGDTIGGIVEDYSHLTPEIVETAVTYARTHPLVGRPSGRPWVKTS